MTHALGGRPTAENLAHRCAATNKRGKQCGSPALDGSKVCRNHLGKADAKALVKTSDRLVALTVKALDRLEEIIETGADDVAERAARTILDRTVPKPGAQHALFVNVGQNDGVPDAPGTGPGERVRARLLALAARAAEPVANPSPLDAFGQGDGAQGDDWVQHDDQVIDAEIIPDPELSVTPAAETTRVVSLEDIRERLPRT